MNKSDPWFYWELNQADRQATLRQTYAEEGLLAADINQGRALMTIRMGDPRELPDLDPEPELIDDLPEAYSDPISAILQAAAYVGLDPEEVCQAAMRTRAAVHDGAVLAARRREASKRREG